MLAMSDRLHTAMVGLLAPSKEVRCRQLQRVAPPLGTQPPPTKACKWMEQGCVSNVQMQRNPAHTRACFWLSQKQLYTLSGCHSAQWEPT